MALTVTDSLFLAYVSVIIWSSLTNLIGCERLPVPSQAAFCQDGVTVTSGISQHTAVDYRQPQITSNNSRSKQWLHALSNGGSSCCVFKQAHLAWSCLQVTEQALRMGTALVHASDADGKWAHLCGDLLDDAEVVRNRCLNLQTLAWLSRVHLLHGQMLLCNNIRSSHSKGARMLCPECCSQQEPPWRVAAACCASWSDD